jgi:hypothetical protein
MGTEDSRICFQMLLCVFLCNPNIRNEGNQNIDDDAVDACVHYLQSAGST